MSNVKNYWEKIISREDFWKNYFDEFGLKDSLSVERLIDIKDIVKNNPDQKFLFAIAKINDKREKSEYNVVDTEKENKFIICPDRTYEENEEIKVENLDSLRLLGLVMTGYIHTLYNDEKCEDDLKKKLKSIVLNKSKPVKNFQNFIENDEIRNKHNKIVENIFDKKLKNIIEKKNDYSLFMVIDRHLYEFRTSHSQLILIQKDISESKIRDKIYSQLQKLKEDFHDITIFNELTKREEEEISTNDTKQILINIILTIIFVINFFYIMPPNIFYQMNNALSQVFEYDKNNQYELDSINSFSEVSDYYMNKLSRRFFSPYNKFNYTVTDAATEDPQDSVVTTNMTDISNVTLLKTASERYYVLNTNLFCGMMINFALSKPIQIVDVNGNVMRRRETAASYYKVTPTQQSTEFLTFKWQDDDPINPNSYYLYFNPSLNQNILAVLNQQLLRTILRSQDLYEFSMTSLIYNSDYKINAIYSLKFILNSYGNMEKSRFFLGYQPFLSTSTKTYSYLLIINIIFVLLLIYVIYLIINSFSNNIIELIVNKNYQFELFEWLDLFVLIITITSEIILFKIILFDSKVFQLDNSSYDDFKNVNENLFQVRNYVRITGICLLLMFFRLIRFLYSAYPSFGVVFQTLQHAYPEILTFLFIIAITFSGVALMSHTAFGWFSPKYYNIEDSFFTLYDMFLGTYDYYTLCKMNACPSITPYFFISFMFIFNFILINVFLCIIRSNYYEMKVKKQLSNEAFAMMAADDSKNFYKKLENLILFKNPEEVEKEEKKEKEDNPNSEEVDNNNQNENENQKRKSETSLWKTFQYHFLKLKITEFCSGSTRTKEDIIKEKSKKYKEIRKKKIIENLNLLLIDYNKEFDQILDFTNYLIYLIVFVSLIFFQLSTGVSDSIVSYMQNHFEMSMNNLVNFKDFEESQDIINNIINSFYGTNSTTCQNVKFGEKNVANYIYLNPPYFRITFRRYSRVKNSENYENTYFKSTIEDNSPLSLDNCGGISEYKQSIVLKNSGGNKNMYMPYIEKGNMSAFSMCGGYAFWFDSTSPYCPSELNRNWALNNFYEIMFTPDLGSYVIDTALFNKYYDYLVYLSVTIRRGYLGKIEYYMNTELIPINRYISFKDFKRLVLEIIYLGFVFYYTFLILLEFYKIFITKLYDKINETEKGEEKLNKTKDSFCKRFFSFDIAKYHKDKGLSLICKLCWDFLLTLIKRLFQLIFIFFSSLFQLIKNDFSNIIQILSLGITYFVIYNWYMIIIYTQNLNFKFSEITEKVSVHNIDPSLKYNLEIINTLSIYYTQYNYWQAVNAILIFFLIIRNLKFSRSIYMQITIISRSISAFFFHLIFMFLVFIGFSLWAYALFSQNLSSFSNIPLVLLNLLLLAFTNITFYKEFKETDSQFASIFVILFTICYVLILTNVLFSIIIESFSEFKLLQHQNKTEYNEVTTIKILKGKIRNFHTIVINYCKNLENCNSEKKIIEDKYESSSNGISEDLKKNKTPFFKSLWEKIVQTTQMKLKYFANLEKIVRNVKNATLEGKILREADFQNGDENSFEDKHKLEDLTIMTKIVTYIVIEILKLKSEDIENYIKIGDEDRENQDSIKGRNSNKNNINEGFKSHKSREERKDDMVKKLVLRFDQKFRNLMNKEKPATFFDKRYRKNDLMPLVASNNDRDMNEIKDSDDFKIKSKKSEILNKHIYTNYENKMNTLIYDLILKYLYIPKEMTNDDMNLVSAYYLYIYKIHYPDKNFKKFQEDMIDIRLELFSFILDSLYSEEKLESSNNKGFENETSIFEERMNEMKTLLSGLQDDDDLMIQLTKKFQIWDSLCLFFFNKNKTLIREIRNNSQFYKYLKVDSENQFANFFRKVHGFENRVVSTNKTMHHLQGYRFDQAINKNLYDQMLEKENFINYESFVNDQSILPLEQLMLNESLIEEGKKSNEKEKLDKLYTIVSDLWSRTASDIHKFSLFFGYNLLMTDDKINQDTLPKNINQSSPEVNFYMQSRHRAHLVKVLSLPHDFSKIFMENIKNAIIVNEIIDENRKFHYLQENPSIEKIFSYLNELKVNYIVLGQVLKKSFKSYLDVPKKIVKESIEIVEMIKQKTELLDSNNKGKYKEFYQLLISKFIYKSLTEYFSGRYKSSDNLDLNKQEDIKKSSTKSEKKLTSQFMRAIKNETIYDNITYSVKVNEMFILVLSLSKDQITELIEEIDDRCLKEFYIHLLLFIYDGLEEYNSINDTLKKDIKEKTALKIYKYCKYLDIKDNSIRYNKQKDFQEKFDKNTDKYNEDLKAFKKNLETTREKLLNELQSEINNRKMKENNK